MHRHILDIGAFPAWARLNNVQFEGITVADLAAKGYGLIVTTERTEENAVLITVPKDLILSLENVWILAKADKHLREVLDAVGDYARVPSSLTRWHTFGSLRVTDTC